MFPDVDLFDMHCIHYYNDEILKEADKNSMIIVGNSIAEIKHCFEQCLDNSINSTDCHINRIYAIREQSQIGNKSDYRFYTSRYGAHNFVYYDINMSAKIAFNNDKKIERFNLVKNVWEEWDNTVMPSFVGQWRAAIICDTKASIEQQCIKEHWIPLVTNKYLSQWLAKGYGELLIANETVVTSFSYKVDEADKQVHESLKVKRFDDNGSEWHDAELIYMEQL